MPRTSIVALMCALVAAALVAQPGSGTIAQQGGIFRVSFTPAAGLDHIDPALSFTTPGWTLLDHVRPSPDVSGQAAACRLSDAT